MRHHTTHFNVINGAFTKIRNCRFIDLLIREGPLVECGTSNLRGYLQVTGPLLQGYLQVTGVLYLYYHVVFHTLDTVFSAQDNLINDYVTLVGMSRSCVELFSDK